MTDELLIDVFIPMSLRKDSILMAHTQKYLGVWKTSSSSLEEACQADKRIVEQLEKRSVSVLDVTEGYVVLESDIIHPGPVDWVSDPDDKSRLVEAMFSDGSGDVPTGFEIEPRALPLGREIDSPSVFHEVRRIYGAEVLRHSYRTTSQALAELINREFYQNRIEFEPSAAEYLGQKTYNLDLVR